MFKKVLKLLLFFIFGIAGGIFADQILWPYFIERPLFYEYRLEQAPVYITEIKEIKVQENIALQDTVERIKNSIIGIKAKNSKIIYGSGFIVSRDGLAIVLNSLLPQGQNLTFLIEDKAYNCQILKRDVKNNLALIKLEGENFITAGFADINNLRLGERVLTIGLKTQEAEAKKIVNEGVLSYISISEDEAQTNIIEKETVQGSVLFNIKGEVIGINSKAKIILVDKIKELAGI